MITGLATASVLALSSPLAGGSVIINEISYNPPGSLGDDDVYEFVELHNRGGRSRISPAGV